MEAHLHTEFHPAALPFYSPAVPLPVSPQRRALPLPTLSNFGFPHVTLQFHSLPQPYLLHITPGTPERARAVRRPVFLRQLCVATGPRLHPRPSGGCTGHRRLEVCAIDLSYTVCLRAYITNVETSIEGADLNGHAKLGWTSEACYGSLDFKPYTYVESMIIPRELAQPCALQGSRSKWR
eukprot:3358712-Pyramimonas_sp.AAC.1